VSTLQALQFQQIGYECAQAPENAGGAAALAKPQLDMNKPIYRCVTFTSVDGTTSTPPPDAINQLLTTYASETMGHLHNLLKTIEKVKESKAGLEGLGGDDGDRGMKRPPSEMSNGGGGGGGGGGDGMSMAMPNLGGRSTTLDFLNSIEMPDMKRGTSLGLGLGLGTQLPAGSIDSEEEEKVNYILAKMYSQKETGDVGFPAFDQHKELLGFYNEQQQPTGNGDEATTVCKFTPLSHFPKLRENTSSTVQRLLNENIRNQSKSVHSLVPEYVGNLVKMKENAMMYHWSKVFMQEAQPGLGI